MAAPLDLAPGALFHGRYEVLAPLGEGGMGVVYKARDRSLDEVVAIKILRPEFAADPKMAERFKGEIRLARKVRHRNVCTIHDYGEAEGLLFISMEYVDGVDVKRILREKGPLPADEAYDLGVQVAEGLQAVHEAGIVHRDLKTPNIIRDGAGTVRLMDFGIAKRYGEATLTATGNIMGTPEYMSPEQAQGHRVDFRSDIYALGVVIYEAFTGRVPFKGDTPISTILKHLNESPPLEAARSLPAEVKPILKRCLAKDPRDRPGSAREVAEALRRAREGAASAPTLRRTIAMGGPPQPRRVTRRLLLAAVPVIVLAAAIGGVRWAGRGVSPVSPPPPENTVAPPPSAELPLPSPMPASLPSALPSERAIAAAGRPQPARVTPTPAASRPAPGPRPAVQPSTVPQPSPSPVAPNPSPAPAERAAGTGWLLVVVRPWAEISVDGRPVGTTPLERFAVASGTHAITVRHPAYPPLTRKVVVRPDQTERLVIDLAREGPERD